MSKLDAAKNIVDRLVEIVARAGVAIPEEPGEHPYDLFYEDEDQLQYECDHSDGADTMVVANCREKAEWKVSVVTYGHRDTYREDLGEYPSRRSARKAMEGWMARNPNGIQPEGHNLLF